MCFSKHQWAIQLWCASCSEHDYTTILAHSSDLSVYGMVPWCMNHEQSLYPQEVWSFLQLHHVLLLLLQNKIPDGKLNASAIILFKSISVTQRLSWNDPEKGQNGISNPLGKPTIMVLNWCCLWWPQYISFCLPLLGLQMLKHDPSEKRVG